MQATGADALEKLRKAQEAIDSKVEPEQGGDWRVRPKKVPYRQINIRIREDLYEALSDLAFYTDGESMSSIAGRAIEKEIRVMLREKGVKI
jgi:predicted DNA-binding protein